MSNRSVLMLSYPFPPAASAAVFRTLRFVKYLPEFGWKPLVLTPRIDAVIPITLDRSLDSLTPAGIVERTGVLRPLVSARRTLSALLSIGRHERISTSALSGSTALSQGDSIQPAKRGAKSLRSLVETLERWAATPDRHIGWLLPAVTAALPLVRRYRPQVIYSSGPPHSTHLIAVMLKWITGLPVVTDFRDPWARPEWKDDRAASSRGTIDRALERLCVRRSDRVILNTDRLCAEFRHAYEPALHDKFLVIPNGYDPDLLVRITELVRHAGIAPRNGEIRLCHAGSLYGQRDLRPVAAAVGRLSAAGHNVTLEQIGEVGQRSELMHFLRENSFEHCVELRDTMPHNETLQRLAAADVLVIIQPGTTIQVPAKLFEMLMFHKPIVAVAEAGATADIIDGFGLGATAAPSDTEAIAAAVLRATNANSDRGTGGRWQDAIDAFDGRELTRRLAVAFDEITKEVGSG
jgi:glycosyltransferase involved in cell wall biosynthesis